MCARAVQAAAACRCRSKQSPAGHGRQHGLHALFPNTGKVPCPPHFLDWLASTRAKLSTCVRPARLLVAGNCQVNKFDIHAAFLLGRLVIMYTDFSLLASIVRSSTPGTAGKLDVQAVHIDIGGRAATSLVHAAAMALAAPRSSQTARPLPTREALCRRWPSMIGSLHQLAASRTDQRPTAGNGSHQGFKVQACHPSSAHSKPRTHISSVIFNSFWDAHRGLQIDVT